MGSKRKHMQRESSSGSEGTSEDPGSLSSSIPSSSQVSSEDGKAFRRLTKTDLKNLIRLEKKIEKEERIIARLKQKKRIKSLIKRQRSESNKNSSSKEQRSQSPINHPTGEVAEGKKLFITGIDEKLLYEEVKSELNVILKSLHGVTGFRIKMKEGCSTYAFVDFASKQVAKEGIDKLRKKKIFGGKVGIYYSQDEQKDKCQQNGQSRKKCFQCKGVGHFARQCQMRKINEESAQKQQTNTKAVELPVKKEVEQIQAQEKTEKTEEKTSLNLRVVKNKSRLNRLLGQS